MIEIPNGLALLSSPPLLPFPVEWNIQRIHLLSLHEKNNNNFPSPVRLRRFCPIEAAKIARKVFLDSSTFFAITGQLFFLSPWHANWNEGRERIKKIREKTWNERTNDCGSFWTTINRIRWMEISNNWKLISQAISPFFFFLSLSPRDYRSLQEMEIEMHGAGDAI